MKTTLPSVKKTLHSNKYTLAVLLGAAVLFLIARLLAAPAKEPPIQAEEYAEYERAVVTQILADSVELDENSDNSLRGEQMLVVRVTSGQYKDKEMQVSNYVGPLYGTPLKEGDKAIVILSTYADGTVRGSVYEFNRTTALIVVVALFLAAAILVGGKTGAKSLIGLAVTLATLFWILLPALMKGAPTLLTVFLVCAYIAVVTLTILGGVSKKTVCAMAGTVAGTAAALLFGLLAQALMRINGLRIDDAEALLQLHQTGTPIALKGLLVAGVVISALGAVMDVTMGISSALAEVHAANPKMDGRSLFRSGMNIGRDMVGTMTNTLILALLGSSFVLILYLYSMELSANQFLSSSYLAIEVVSSISGGIGVILSIPLTALICSAVLTKKK